MTSKLKQKKMNGDRNARILEIELYLTTKIMNNRGKEYKPIAGDEDQPLRDELAMLRKKLNQNKDEQ